MKLVMSDNDFRSLKLLIEDEFGLSLKTHSRETLTRKLMPRLKALRLHSMHQYVEYISDHPLSRIELLDLPGCLMNTESYFLREYSQFSLFLELFKHHRKKSQTGGTVRILSAGCSEGQEPYSISMLLKNQPQPFSRWNVQIVGLDINLIALERARHGLYNSYSMRSPEFDTITNYFQKAPRGTCGPGRECFRLKSDVISSVEFVHANILHPLTLKGLGDFDYIFCRNVLMYMSKKAADLIAINLWEALSAGGRLFIGQSESLRKRDDLFDPINSGDVTVYQRKAT